MCGTFEFDQCLLPVGTEILPVPVSADEDAGECTADALHAAGEVERVFRIRNPCP